MASLRLHLKTKYVERISKDYAFTIEFEPTRIFIPYTEADTIHRRADGTCVMDTQPGSPRTARSGSKTEKKGGRDL